MHDLMSFLILNENLSPRTTDALAAISGGSRASFGRGGGKSTNIG